MKDTIVFNSIEIETKKLYTRKEVLEILGRGGATDRDLTNIRDKYSEEFGNELIWRYPIMVGEALGTVIIPVQEGFLSIAYDSVKPDVYEIYDLKNEILLSDHEVTLMLDDWALYSQELIKAMENMREILLESKGGQ